MRKMILALSVVSLLGLNTGCATAPGSDPVYLDDPGIQAVTTLSQFDEIADNTTDNSRGREMKLAGAIASIDETDDGYLVLAKWLPYRKKQALEIGPVVTQIDETRHFLIRFHGKREKFSI